MGGLKQITLQPLSLKQKQELFATFFIFKQQMMQNHLAGILLEQASKM